MSRKAKGALIGGGLLAVAAVAFVALGGKDLPLIDAVTPDPTCPLTGEEPARAARAERPAVGIKIENSRVARPLSGLEEADLVYEELVEGGETRFMAIFQCGAAAKAGPVRSARIVDPSLLKPITRILGYSGANQIVIAALNEADVVSVTEMSPGASMQRIPRTGLSSEHTLYADSDLVRRAARKEHSDPPPEDMFSFGDLPEDARGRRARTITLNFGGASTIVYEWNGTGWGRSQDGEPFLAETGEQIAPVNVLVEEHLVNLSSAIVDSAGNPSIEIADETGSGRAVLYRNGRAVKGRWIRESVDAPVRFETRDGEEMVFAVGSIWIELVPSSRGEVKGSFSHDR